MTEKGEENRDKQSNNEVTKKKNTKRSWL